MGIQVCVEKPPYRSGGRAGSQAGREAVIGMSILEYYIPSRGEDTRVCREIPIPLWRVGGRVGSQPASQPERQAGMQVERP